MLNLAVIDLKENEHILMTYDEILVCAGDNKFTLAMCITNMRILLFQDVNKQLLKFRPTTMSGYKPKYEMVYELEKKNVKAFDYKKGINYLKVENEHILEIYCENLEKYILKK